MTDTSAPGNPNPPQDPNGDKPAAPVMRVLGQYVKDLSFENPGHAPVQSQPNIDLGIDVGATPHADGNGLFEVSLKLSAKAMADSKVMFISELDYAGLFQLQNVAQEQLEPMLLIEAPRLLFPFARRIIAEITREGGFPPLLIDPVDFVALYQAQVRRANSAGTATQQ
ncbi:MAG: protein-export chaperone SecB [Alphaproteobacteria bacterium]|nr:protein-export chaperone SecB [Alphaproteobacteria bacterium]MBU2084904.1 protein-export chaperone SecB [Alphaproteobacteria bacterium]MBU2144018.1 protein-export chaperone SecB [Alphaproteobacteria bacterium]MBU2198133.1 protein-export chaperone SecB [Alphaproteobacteria bacterium]